jgi:hypothetical protein
MASTPTSNSQLSQLKAKLKTWERQFKAMEGRPPSKADIKANPEIGTQIENHTTASKENGDRMVRLLIEKNFLSASPAVCHSRSENVLSLQLVA